MDASSIDITELESTREDDQQWLNLKEESIIFNESFVSSKFNDLEDDLKESETQNNQEINIDKTNKREDIKDVELAHKLIGLVEVEEYTFKKNAVQQWTKVLIDSCISPRDSSSSFLSLVKKRLDVQQRIYKAYLREKERRSRGSASTSISEEGSDSDNTAVLAVPVVVRLGVLTLFPIIESLSKVKDANYIQLCRQVLNMLIEVLSSLPPLALHREPADCLDAFQNFILSLIKGHNFTIDSEDKAQAVIAFVALAISRGNAKDVLQVIDLLLRIHRTMPPKSELKLRLKNYIKQLADHKKDQDVAVLNDRAFLDSWTINQPFIDSIPLYSTKTDAIASDGTFLYVHSYSKGIQKIGTGFGGTIKGHVYASNSNFRKGDKQKTMVYVNGKLYYLLPQGGAAVPVPSTSTSVNIESSSIVMSATELLEEGEEEDNEEEQEEDDEDKDIDKESSEDNSIVADKEEKKPEVIEEDTRLQIAVIDTVTLKDEKTFTLKENSNSKSFLLSDGYYTYLVSRRKSSKKDEKEADLDEMKIILETYDFSVSENTPINTIELGSVSTPSTNSLSKEPVKEPPLLPAHWERATFYTTGYQICAFIPGDPATVFTKVRVFSVSDGKHIADAKIKTQPVELSCCYDAVRNIIWTYDDNLFEAWKNLSIAPKHAYSIPTPKAEIYPSYSPEFLLSKPEFSLQNESSPLQTALLIISNMDRLARQHPQYGEPLAVDSSSLAAITPNEYIFFAEPEPQLFNILHSVMLQALECNFPEDIKGYFILSCLRILKINMYELLQSGKDYRSSSFVEKSNIWQLRKLLDNFIQNPPSQQSAVANAIQTESIYSLTLGFAAFYPSTSDQNTAILNMLETAQTLTLGKKKLLEVILEQLSEADYVSYLLLRDFSDNTNKNSSSKSEDKMEIDSQEGEKMDIEDKVGKRLVNALVEYVFNEAMVSLDNLSNAPKTAPILSPGLRLLLFLQRDILCNSAFSGLLFDYSCAVLLKSRLLIDHVLQKYAQNLPTGGLNNVLKSSMLGVILQSLATALCGKNFSSNFSFASNILPHLMKLISALDLLNKQLPQLLDSDKRYLRRLTAKKDRKTFVESKHPYLQGKNQVKQTVTFSGAKALSLRFDPRCRTVSSSTDILQLFKSGSLTDPVLNPKDWKPYVFSGSNWPKQAIVVQGDTVTFLFSGPSRQDIKNPEHNKQRWGFKCKITELMPPDHYEDLINHWLLDLENTLSLISSRFASRLVEGEPIGDIEKRCAPWLEANLLNGGLESEGEQSHENSHFLTNFINNTGDASLLYAWMLKQIPRRNLSAIAKDPLESAERYIIAAMLKHLLLVDELREFVQLLKVNSPIDTRNTEHLKLLIQEAAKITLDNQLKGQLENLWRASIKDKPTFDAFHTSWRGEMKEKLVETCELKGVEYDSREETLTIKKLYEKLQEDISKKKEDAAEPNSYESMANPVIDRSKLLLRMRPRNSDDPKKMKQSKFFNKKVKEVRKWLQAFKSSKKEGALSAIKKPKFSTTPVSQNLLVTQDLEQILKIHESRAKSRIEGLNYYHQLLELVSFSSARHQVLGSLGAPLSTGGHYFDFLSTCGPSLSTKVAHTFTFVFNQIIRILKDKNSDTASRLLALVLCGLNFQEADVDVLRASQIFPLLQQIVGECNQKILTMLTKPPPFRDTMQIEKPSKEINKEEEKREREQQEWEEKEELQRLRRLRLSSWTAFRLLATRCVSWGSETEDAVESENLRELQIQIFELMCSELKNMSQKLIQTDEDAEQSFELLSLLCLLGGSPKGYKSLSRQDNLVNLVSILKADNAEPRSKRLALRLCRRLLPSQDKETVPKIIEFFLQEVGSSLLPEKGKPKARDEKTKVILGQATEINLRMDLDDENDQEDEEEDEEEFEADEEQFSIYLNNWNLGPQRLIEICQVYLFFISFTQKVTLVDFFGSGFVDRPAMEAKAQQIINEMSEEGKALLKTATLANCNSIGSALCALGGSVTIQATPASLFDDKTTQTNRNLKKLQKKSNPTIWVNGEVAQALASEYVYILRMLLDNKKNQSWNEEIRKAIYKSLDIGLLLSGKASREHIYTALGALSVLGGYNESIRIGGKVEVVETSDIKKKATVVESLGNSVEVIFDSDPTRSARRIANNKVIAVPELDFDPKIFPLTQELVSAILTLVKGGDSTLPAWQKSDLKARSLKVLNKLLENPSSAKLFLQGPASDAVGALIKLANSSKPSSRQEVLERESLILSERLWDRITKPIQDSDDSKVKTMTDILPHFPHSRLVEISPTTWNTEKLQGFLFRGDDKRKLEYVGIDPNPLGRRTFLGRAPPPSQPVTEIALLANAPIPTTVPEFYFEVTIDQTESNGSLISIGLIPEGAKTWGIGSYKYQANAKKTTFGSGNRRLQNDYGSFFRAKNTIGCGWNRDEKILYFTKDGVDQGPAWTGLNFPGRMLPAVGISKGVHVTINFGQEPFKFKLVIEGETKEEREKRKKEEEEKRKKLQEEEAEKQKKMKEDERASQVLAAQPLLNMGFSLKQALVALKQTGFSGPDAASNWLIENMSYNFDEEEEENKEEEKEEKKEPEKEKEKEKEEEKKEVKEKPSEKEMQIEKPPEESYNSNASQNYSIGDNYTFSDPVPSRDEKSKTASEWEDNVIPTIKAFMEKDGFSPFEVEEYLQQIRTRLSQGNEQLARGIISTIVGEAGGNFEFPNSLGSKSAEKVAKIEEIKTGMWMSVSKTLGSDTKHWVSQMDKTLGLIGMVRAIDHQNGLVLLQFYDPETAELNEWWYPVKLLEKPDKFIAPPFLDLQEDTLQSRIHDSQSELAAIFARKSVLSLLYHSGLTLTEGPLLVKDMLQMAGTLETSTPLFSIPSDTEKDSGYLNALKHRLLSLYESGMKLDLTELLVKEVSKILDMNGRLDIDGIVNVTSAKPPAANAEVFKVENARSLIVEFDRTSTSLPANSQASINFYYDEACTNLIRSFPEKSKFSPIVISSNQFYVKLLCNTSTHRNNCKWKFSIIPVHPSFALAFWLADFLLDDALKFVSDVAVCTPIYNSAVNYVYNAKVPTILKQSVFYLIGKILKISKDFTDDKKPQLNRLSKLKDEMVALYEVEKKRENFLFSSYLQSLVELMVSVKESGGIEGLPVDDPMEIDTETKSDQKEKEQKPAQKEQSPPKPDETLSIAIVLAQSLKEAEKTTSEEASSEDQDLADAIALSKSTEIEPKPVEPQSPQISQAEQPSMNIDTSMLDEDMDEEMKLALMLSMQEPKTESPKVEPKVSDQKPPLPSQPPEPPKPEQQAPTSFNFVPPVQPPTGQAPPLPFSFGSLSPFSFGASAPSSNQSPRRGRRSRSRSPPRSSSADANAANPPPATPIQAPATPSTAPANPPTPAPAPQVKSPLLPWFSKVVETKRALETIVYPEKHQSFMREMIKKAWNAAKKETIKERIILVDNLPLLDADKREELENILRKTFGEIASMDHEIFMPLDEHGKQTKGYAFLKVASPQKIDAVVRKMHKYKLRAPTLLEEATGPNPVNLKSSLRSSAALPRGTVKITRFLDLEKSEDARVNEYMQFKLVQAGNLTPKCKGALVEIFNLFGGDKEGALIASNLNNLQLKSNGKPLTKEQVSYCFKHYKTKLVGEPKQPGLTLDGFLDLYQRQCVEAPMDTWEELTKLGFDLDFHRTRYTTFEEALESQKDWPKMADYELMSYCENLYTEVEVTTPVYLALDQVKPLEATGVQFRSLSKLPLPAIRLRFEIIRQLNSNLPAVLPLINLDRIHEGSIAYLISTCRHLIFHMTKLEYIYDVIEKTAVLGNQPTVNIDRLKLAAKKEKEAKTDSIINHTMFGIAFQQLRIIDPTNLRQKKPGGAEPHFAVRINFKGENVQGEGGPYRQFFTDVSTELQGILPLFLQCPNAQSGLGENRDKWIVNPSADSPTHLSMFEFLGRLMGLSVRTGVLLNMDLPPFFWKQIVGQKPTITDLKHIDISISKVVKYFSKITKEQLETECPEQNFTTWLSNGTRVPLKEGGENIRVTFENKDEYVKLVEEFRLNEGKLQIAAIRRGLGDIIPLPLLHLCTWQDLEWKVCGKPYIDVNLLKRHTTCSGVSPDAPHIGYFWQTLTEFNQADRRGFLRFAWAQERLPVTDEEFERTKTRMMIKPFSGLSDPNAAFPKADTCFFNIMLPEYTNQRVLREKLVYAIYTDSHSMNADEPQEDELTTVNGRRPPPPQAQDSSDSEEE